MIRAGVTAAIAATFLGTGPAIAASPSPSPLPIRGVSVEVQRQEAAPGLPGGVPANHLEVPPFARPRGHFMPVRKPSRTAPRPTPTPTSTPTPAP